MDHRGERGRGRESRDSLPLDTLGEHAPLVRFVRLLPVETGFTGELVGGDELFERLVLGAVAMLVLRAVHHREAGVKREQARESRRAKTSGWCQSGVHGDRAIR